MNEEISVYAPKPNRYRISSAIAHTMKLATARGNRNRTKIVTTGSNRNAMIVAMTTVMKKTLPKYSSATPAAAARILMLVCPALCDAGGVMRGGIEGGVTEVGVSVDIQALWAASMMK